MGTYKHSLKKRVANRKACKKYSLSHKEQKKEYARKYSKLHEEKFRDTAYKRYYGITLNDYNKMFQEQRGHCAICNKHQNNFKHRLGVDHCHITKLIRKLVCDNCNHLIALLEKDFSLADKVFRYLEERK